VLGIRRIDIERGVVDRSRGCSKMAACLGLSSTWTPARRWILPERRGAVSKPWRGKADEMEWLAGMSSVRLLHRSLPGAVLTG
jgi:pyrroloquinoline quinone (PQQ) biosynthesis protein C